VAARIWLELSDGGENLRSCQPEVGDRFPGRLQVELDPGGLEERPRPGAGRDDDRLGLQRPVGRVQLDAVFVGVDRRDAKTLTD
jgi:hypothetical protein